MSAPVQQLMFMDPGPAALFLTRAAIARGSALDATHVSAYTTMIDKLVADGVWGKFDILRIHATQDSTTAMLNLIKPTSTGITHGSPSFTADRGFTGVDGSTTVYIDAQYNPTTDAVQLTQNSNHISCWSLSTATSGASSGGVAMGISNGTTNSHLMNLWFGSGDNHAYFRANFNPSIADLNASVSDALGHYVANRSASNAVQGYKNKVQVATGTNASVALINGFMYELAQDATGAPGPASGGPWPIAMTSYGASLSSTDITNFYDAVHAYLVAVGAI